MSTLLFAQGVEKTWGGRWVLQGCDLTVSLGDRIGLVGANGCGKSTFLSILSGEVPLDHGRVGARGRVAGLAQNPALEGETVQDVLDAATRWHGDLLEAYHQALHDDDHDTAATHQSSLDVVGWTVAHRVAAVADRLGVAPRDAKLTSLSGGEGRRLALASTLLSASDVLLLDEPTNHLDGETVAWLESYLMGYRGAVVMVTHDRYLLEAVANRIVEIEDGVCVTYDDASYADYLVARVERRARLEQAESRRMSLLAREAEWASRSPAARSTKQQARLARLAALQDAPSLKAPRDLSLNLSRVERTGMTVFEVHGLSKGYGTRTLFSDVDLTVQAGDRLGLVGPNGVGKSTFLRLLQGIEVPDAGQVVRGSRLKVGVLDQHRTGLDDADTLREAVGGGNDRVVVGDDSVHVITFLERFLFPRDMQGQHVGGLSGGERARLLLAKLLLQGANVLILDEPTNDLDLLTLRVLEDALLDFPGTVIVVTHDRAFLDRVCTGVVGFTPQANGVASVTCFADRLQYAASAQATAAAALESAPARAPAPTKRRARAVKPGLSWRETRELEAVPAEIERVEGLLSEIDESLADPATYQGGGSQAAELTAKRVTLEGELEAIYARWEDLEERQGAS